MKFISYDYRLQRKVFLMDDKDYNQGKFRPFFIELNKITNILAINPENSELSATRKYEFKRHHWLFAVV